MLTMRTHRVNGERRFAVMDGERLVLLTTGAAEAANCVRRGVWEMAPDEVDRLRDASQAPLRIGGRPVGDAAGDSGGGGHPLVQG